MNAPEAPLRQLIAEEAARLIYDEGFRDYRLAKQKAMYRFGNPSQNKHQPSNEEVEQALIAYIRLFDAEEQYQILHKHREIALEAMQFLEGYQPTLTGAALVGTSGPHSAVTLHLIADSAEDVIFHLEEERIPFETQERLVKLKQQQVYVPLLRLYADDVEVELMIFLNDGHHNLPPISAITGKPTQRATAKKVKALLQA